MKKLFAVTGPYGIVLETDEQSEAKKFAIHWSTGVEINWPMVRNIIRFELKRFHKGADLDDATQDGCGLVLIDFDRGEDLVLSIWRAIKRVSKREIAWDLYDANADVWNRAKRQDWELEIDPAYLDCVGRSQSALRGWWSGIVAPVPVTPRPQHRSLPGVHDHERRAPIGGTVRQYSSSLRLEDSEPAREFEIACCRS